MHRYFDITGYRFGRINALCCAANALMFTTLWVIYGSLLAFAGALAIMGFAGVLLFPDLDKIHDWPVRGVGA